MVGEGWDGEGAERGERGCRMGMMDLSPEVYGTRGWGMEVVTERLG